MVCSGTSSTVGTTFPRPYQLVLLALPMLSELLLDCKLIPTRNGAKCVNPTECEMLPRAAGSLIIIFENYSIGTGRITSVNRSPAADYARVPKNGAPCAM